MSRNSYAVSWQRKTICCETANRRSREEGGGINMNKSEREREIKKLFLARPVIRFASLLHHAKLVGLLSI